MGETQIYMMFTEKLWTKEMGLVFEVIQGILNQCNSHFCMEIIYDISYQADIGKQPWKEDYIEEGSTSGEKVKN